MGTWGEGSVPRGGKSVCEGLMGERHDFKKLKQIPKCFESRMNRI